MKIAAFALGFALLIGVATAGEARSVEDLRKSLESADYQTRRKAVLACEGRDESALLDRLLELARADGHPNIRMYAAEVLGGFDDDRIFPLLVEMTKGGRFPGPRQGAYAGLGRLGDPRAYDVLITGLGTTDRAYVLRALGRFGDERAFLPMKEAFLEHASADIYVAELGPEALLEIDRDRAIPVLLEAFDLPDYRSRASLTKALELCDDDRVRRRMEARLAADAEAIRHSAIGVLARVGDKTNVEALIARFRDHPEDRIQVATALGMLKATAAAGMLADSLTDGTAEGHLRLALAGAIGRMGRKEDTPLLAATLKKAVTAGEKVTLIDAIATLCDPRAIATLVPFLDDGGFHAQPPAISSIWGFPHNVAVRRAAHWAILTLRDGEPPFPKSELSRFRGETPLPKDIERIDALKKWWKGNADDPRYRLPR